MSSVSDYFKKISGIGNFKLVIVGQDPYPRLATGIPFSKPSWDDLKRNHSGHYLFSALIGPDYRTDYKTPDKLVISLADKGVAILNASYRFMRGKAPSEKKHRKFVEEAYALNGEIFKKAKRILLCGQKTIKMCGWVGVIPDDSKIHGVPHPAPYGRQDSPEWKKYWADYALSKL